MIIDKEKSNKSKKFNEKLNMDVATSEKIKETNDKLVDHLDDTGEHVAASQVRYLINKEDGTKSDKKIADGSIHGKLLITNKRILATLEKIQADMHDEQDTSIKSVYKEEHGVGLATQRQESFDKGDGAVGKNMAAGFGRFGFANKNKDKPKDKKKSKQKTKKTSKVKAPIKKSKFKPPKSTSSMLKGGAKVLGKIASRALPILALGMAVYDGYQGWNKADELLDLKEGEEATTANKASSAAGSIISGLTFGLADAGNSSKGINNLVGGNKVIEKYSNMGIIDHDTIGDSEIDDWDKLKELKAKEIQEIIDIDDWDDDDIEKLKRLKELADITEKDIRIKNKNETNDNASTVQKAVNEQNMVEAEKPKKVNYTMKSSLNPDVDQTVKNPDDYRVDELFKLHNTDSSAVDDLEPVVLSNLKSMAAEYFDTFGEKIQINSAFRSFEEQAKLKETHGEKAASPGKSMHNYGLAIDMNTVNAEKSIDAGLFNKYGFKRPVAGETWHVEPNGINREAIRENGIKAESTNKVIAQTQPENNDDETETNNDIKTVKTAAVVNKTSEIVKEDEVASTAKLPDTQVETNKDLRENIIGKFNENLTKQTVMYDTGTKSKAIADTIVPIISNNINNTSNSENNGEGRLLNYFS